MLSSRSLMTNQFRSGSGGQRIPVSEFPVNICSSFAASMRLSTVCRHTQSFSA